MSSTFGTRELIATLKCLGFKQQRQTGSRHLKFSSPKPVSSGTRSFIIVLQGKSTYDPITCRKIFKEIVKLGFTEEEIHVCGIE